MCFLGVLVLTYHTAVQLTSNVLSGRVDIPYCCTRYRWCVSWACWCRPTCWLWSRRSPLSPPWWGWRKFSCTESTTRDKSTQRSTRKNWLQLYRFASRDNSTHERTGGCCTDSPHHAAYGKTCRCCTESPPETSPHNAANARTDYCRTKLPTSSHNGAHERTDCCRTKPPTSSHNAAHKRTDCCRTKPPTSPHNAAHKRTDCCRTKPPTSPHNAAHERTDCCRTKPPPSPHNGAHMEELVMQHTGYSKQFSNILKLLCLLSEVSAVTLALLHSI